MDAALIPLWDKLRYPRQISAAMIGFYTVLTIGGAVALLGQSEPLTRWIGLALTMTGIVGVSAAFFAIWWLERAAVAALFFGLLPAIICITATAPHLEDGARALIVALLTGLWIIQPVRWWRIIERPYPPGGTPQKLRED